MYVPGCHRSRGFWREDATAGDESDLKDGSKSCLAAWVPPKLIEVVLE